MSWMEIMADELLEPDLVLQDFIRAVQTARPTVNQQDIAQHTNFTNDFGEFLLLAATNMLACPPQ